MKFAVVVFPGSNCDDDAYQAIRVQLQQPVSFIWHRSQDLENADAVILPGGFSYGDYLRTGAIARFSPVLAAVKRFADGGGVGAGHLQRLPDSVGDGPATRSHAAQPQPAVHLSPCTPPCGEHLVALYSCLRARAGGPSPTESGPVSLLIGVIRCGIIERGHEIRGSRLSRQQL